MQYEITIENLEKRFGRRRIFSGVTRKYTGEGIYGISGFNGAGKSTFVKMIAGVLSPSKGKITHFKNGNPVPEEAIHQSIGFMAPYLTLYDEFTAKENLFHAEKIRGCGFEWNRISELLTDFKLQDRTKDFVRSYSSGMKQRLKFVFALAHRPPVLLLDEPTSNLDVHGKEILYKIVREYGKENIVMIASNEESDLKLCTEVLQLEDFKEAR